MSMKVKILEKKKKVQIKIRLLFKELSDHGLHCQTLKSPSNKAVLNPVALRTAKTPLSFGRSEGNRVKMMSGLVQMQR